MISVSVVKLIMKFITFFVAIFTPFIATAQIQTVRGSVFENTTGLAIAGAKIICSCLGNPQTTFTDSNGEFRFTAVPVGRQSFVFSASGFYDKHIQHLDVSSGKELVLHPALEEKVETTGTAVITVRKDPREKPINDMAAVSSRQFSVEETQRYAAAVNDPARMAMGFAGVIAPDDGNNIIVIRGNAPNGLIWRMEGMDIPNPNHFSNVGTSGGGVTILSAQLLSNSDFFTGAFPAEYGNGLSGVFDLRLRKGNNEKREHTIQFGLLGLDLATEGPLGKKGGSYLLNYRYSTLSMISALGIELGDAVTRFQDLSYNIHLPVNKKIQLSFFGFTGLSNQFSSAKLDTGLWATNPEKAFQWDFLANSIFNGGKISWQAGKRHHIELKTGLGLIQNGYNEKEYTKELLAQTRYKERYNQARFTLAVQSRYRSGRRSQLRSGVIFNRQYFDLFQDVTNAQKQLVRNLESEGNAPVLQAYSQYQLRPGLRWTINAGLHGLYFGLNGTASVEPRLGVKYKTGKKNWLSAGYGMHSQVLSIATYEVKNASGGFPNRNLKLAKANHYVVGFDQLFGKSWHVKTEVYKQQLYNLAVSPEPGNPFYLGNSLEGYYPDTLISTGKARSYGAEITIERFFTGNYYVLVTGSLSDAKYTDAHGKTHNSRFNVGHTLAVLGGKEWIFGSNRLSANFKLHWLGGMRDNPIDLVASRQEQRTVRDYSRPFTWQNPDYFRVDTKISYKINRKKHSITWSLDLQNSSNRKNVWGSYYDKNKDRIAYYTQAPLIPILAYKVEF